MPSFELFDEHFDAMVDGLYYEIRGTSWDGDWTAQELYDLIEEATTDEAAWDALDDLDGDLSLASSVLYTLHFEWI